MDILVGYRVVLDAGTGARKTTFTIFHMSPASGPLNLYRNLSFGAANVVMAVELCRYKAILWDAHFRKVRDGSDESAGISINTTRRTSGPKV